ncbi:MAG TPA: hypothetical protein VES20_04440 [Bryobacteraceae bacterium]|nr:hypothetical protein [Bryobacteraceae bacterium]
MPKSTAVCFDYRLQMARPVPVPANCCARRDLGLFRPSGQPHTASAQVRSVKLFGRMILAKRMVSAAARHALITPS